ncbi:MAG: hypothetical protein ACE5MH_03460 [Terriglobia bacterium]
MSNIILWAHQATVDHTYRVGDDIALIARKLNESGFLVKRSRNPNKADKVLTNELKTVQMNGLPNDRMVDVTALSTKDIPGKLQKVREQLKKYEDSHEVHIGGNPAIAAIRGYLVRQGPEDTDLPLVFYAGLYPDSVKEVLEKYRPDLVEAFRVPYRIKAHPQSIGLETARAKLVLIYGPGRALSDLAPEGNFTRYFNLLESVMAGTTPKSRTVFAINAPTLRKVSVGGKEMTELDLAKQLVKELKKSEFGDRVRIFVATRGFRTKEAPLEEYARATLSLLEEADIISASDTEIDALHTAYRGEHHDDPLAYKLRELPFEAIKVCHSADGVIMDLGCRPERIITSKRFQADPAGFLEEILRLSADGATYALDATAGLGRTANEAMIRIYSRNVAPENRQTDRFRTTFLRITEPMPAGMVSIASARVVRTLGAVVGLGAIFDGLLLSFLMRD